MPFFNRRTLLRAAPALLLFPPAFTPRAHAQRKPSRPVALSEAESRLLGDYASSLNAAYWAAAQGPRAVAVLAAMLSREPSYRKRSLGGEGLAVGAFPFNALWALAHIPGDASRAALERFRRETRDPGLREQARLALAGHALRDRQRSAKYGVLIGGTTATILYAAPSDASKALRQLKPGQAVRLLEEKITRPGETGARGGPAVFDRVELLPSGPTGFVQRAGDDFSPFF